MEEYKKRIISMFQKVTIIIYAVLFVLFSVCVFGIIHAGGDDNVTVAFALLFLFLAIMSWAVYTPFIINLIGDWIIKALQKKKKKGKHDELLYCMLFSFAPMVIFFGAIGLLALIFVIF